MFGDISLSTTILIIVMLLLEVLCIMKKMRSFGGMFIGVSLACMQTYFEIWKETVTLIR